LTILVTAIGTASAKAVIQSLRQTVPGVRIIGTDLNAIENVPNSRLVDRFIQVPSAVSERFAIRLFQICLDEDVDFLIPLTDPEVDALSGMEARFRLVGTVITQSNPASIRISRDKRLVHDTFAHDFLVNVIPTRNQDHITPQSPFPLLAKKRRGRSSEGMIRYEDFEQWSTCCERTSDYIVQPFLDGEIFTVDVVRTKNGSFGALARHERVRNARGLGLEVTIQPDSELHAIAGYVSQELNLTGAINIEFLVRNGISYLMDVNPRCSGGVHFSMEAGFDVIAEHLEVFGVMEAPIHQYWNTLKSA
jgi:carbamoyl-phosphate synthase large subunit